MSKSKQRRLMIPGSGPAGYSAAVNAARATGAPAQYLDDFPIV